MALSDFQKNSLFVAGIVAIAVLIGANVWLMWRVSKLDERVQLTAQVARIDVGGANLTQWLRDVQEWIEQAHQRIEWGDTDPTPPPSDPPGWGLN